MLLYKCKPTLQNYSYTRFPFQQDQAENYKKNKANFEQLLQAALLFPWQTKKEGDIKKLCFPFLHRVKSVEIRSFFWSVFSCIWTEYRKLRTREISVFRHFSRSDPFFFSFFSTFKERFNDLTRVWESVPRSALSIILKATFIQQQVQDLFLHFHT